ncbi:hypothetical protein FB565_001090 [Actinoplanes lutulentus]|uniref:type IV toxin-antitoxin system AbiEi family antitoxin domain-containing protein n=1 Tax=Actinoplanes lutulentus TaxID=1287878 RepID=UPI00179A8B7B|nr:type IV toxin-antitoxin system AbiEi family antitoxin domain-containing protein [Actinoplanes lutulentus]MBB2941386.1 hypothetical protein [Actinoplanes lutulentus]
MDHIDPRFRELLRRQQGVVAWQQARRWLSEKEVRHRVDSGRWQRAHRGVYLAHDGPISEPQRWWVASLATGEGRPALLAGITALSLRGFRRPNAHGDGTIHVLVADGRVDRDVPPR